MEPSLDVGKHCTKRTAEYILHLCIPYELFGGFNPFENYIRQIGSFPQVEHIGTNLLYPPGN